MKENKYQEALDIIKETLLHEHLFDEDKWNEVNDVMKPYFSTIQKLIDKETPMKPLSRGWFGGIMIFKCSNCNDSQNCIYNAPKRCRECGQKIDWSEHE